jgi:Cellulose synthase subunit D
MTAVADTPVLSYLARRGVAAQWRGFLRALVETLDANLDIASRDALLRAVGARLGGLTPLPACSSLPELEARMNEALAASDWGWVEIALDPQDRSLVLTHSAAPTVAAGPEAHGGWIAAVLEGLYGAWLGAQPGSDPGLAPRRTVVTAATVTFRYGPE